MASICLVPMLEDNFSYLIIDKAANVAAAVDPVQPEVAMAAAESLGVEIVASLTTHNVNICMHLLFVHIF